MVGIHKRLHELQQGQRRVVRASVDGLPVFQYVPTSPQHPLQTVADEMRKSVTLLCLDEMQVTDVADGELPPSCLPRAMREVMERKVMERKRTGNGRASHARFERIRTAASFESLLCLVAREGMVL
jgi:predicted ATPase